MFMPQLDHVSAISILPDDILTVIFLYFPIPTTPIRNAVSRDIDLAPYEPDPDAKDKTWLRISHVCQRWRAISLSCSNVWSTINVTSLQTKLALASLKRAQRAPLTVIADWTTLYSSDFDVLEDTTAEALFHLSHTRHLIVRGDMSRSAYERIIPIMQAQEADLLETLQLSTKAYVEDSDMVPVNLPAALFLQRAPRLRRLALHGAFSFGWHNTVFSGSLTHLSLRHISSTAIPTYEALFDVLRRCPLEVLSLVASLPAPVGWTFNPERDTERLPRLSAGDAKLQLSQLRTCTLEDHGIELAEFIRRIDVPRTCHVSLFVGRQNPIADLSGVIPSPLSPVMSTLRDFCASRNTLHQADLHFEQRRGARFQWIFSGRVTEAEDAPCSIIELSMGGTADPDLVHVPVEDAPAGSFLSGLFLIGSRMFPLPAVRSVRVSVRSVTCGLFWDVLMYLDNVESITVVGPGVRSFAVSLDEYAQLPNFLARLGRIVLAHADLNFPFVEVACLESALRRRRGNALPSPAIVLEYCEIPQGALETLESESDQPIECVGKPDVWTLDALSSDEESDSDWDSESENDEFPYNAIVESDAGSDAGSFGQDD
ncbi:unnamed protein product [Peniophora sp. CBMAI 1063]|nr:unnamed protein product [Peniophora sp. CBMAI 1063]